MLHISQEPKGRACRGLQRSDGMVWDQGSLWSLAAETPHSRVSQTAGSASVEERGMEGRVFQVGNEGPEPSGVKDR